MECCITGRLPGNKYPIVRGSLRIPASKSHTIRALLIAAFARGESRLGMPLVSHDSLSCRKMIEAMGAKVCNDGEDWLVEGFGMHPKKKDVHFNVGNSGTSLYLLSALASLFDFKTQFDGDEQVQQRSAEPLLRALGEMGATVESGGGGCAPYSITGPISPYTIHINCPVSQFLSGLLMTAPLISPSERRKDTEIFVDSLNEAPYVGITLDWLNFQNIRYDRQNWDWFCVPSGQQYHSYKRTIPGDWSSATFFLVAAAITGGTLILEGVDITDSQGDKDVLEMLSRMGCRWQIVPDGVRIEGGKLKGAVIDLNATPDALPAMSVAACFAEGETQLINVPQARMKETDRIAVLTAELRKLGADVRELPDGMLIRGCAPMEEGRGLLGSHVDGHQDHRVVMALAVAGLACRGKTFIKGAEASDVTFPGFFDLLSKVTQ